MNFWQQQETGGLDAMSAWAGTARPDAASAPSPTTLNPGDAFRGDQGASDLLGKLSRAQWEDWRNRFAPYISTLADMAADPGAGRDASRMAKESVGTAFDASRRGLDLQRRGMGVQLSKGQQQNERRGSGLARTASMVSAGNEARMSAQDRQQKILAGGMGISNIPDRVLDQ